MTTPQDVLVQMAQVEAFGRVSLAVAKAVGSDPGPHEAAIADAQEQQAALRKAKVKAPADLATQVADALGALRVQYEEHVASAEERLAYPAAVKQALGVVDAAEEQRIQTARAWLSALAEVEGGV